MFARLLQKWMDIFRAKIGNSPYNKTKFLVPIYRRASPACHCHPESNRFFDEIFDLNGH